MEKLLTGLNEKQKEAVTYGDGPLLIIAGAGSGKTKVLTSRIAHLIEKGVSPYEILAITFTNKAAEEMKNRIAVATSNFTTKALWVSTFHSMCNRILRRDIEALGYSTHYNIYDSSDQENLMKKVLKELNIDDKKFTAKAVIYAISILKNNLISPEQANKKASDYYEETVAKIYKHYQRKLQTVDSLDFDDLMYLTLELFKKKKEVLEYYQDRFKYIFIDEYQDTNYVQYLLSKMLGEKHKNICVVGDPDQSIYGWRGADMGNILNFEKDNPGAKVVFLEQNYRSTEQILAAANSVIKNNSDRKPKDLWTNKKEGDLITCFEAETESEEAVYLAREIERQVRKGYKYQDMAILYRTNAQSRIIEKSLARYGIAYRLFGGLSFFKRKEIKDIIAYLQFLNNPRDQIAFERIINTPKRGIGSTTVDKILNFVSVEEVGIEESMKRANEYLNSGTAKKVLGFLQMIGEFRTMEGCSLTELTEAIINKTGYLKELELERTDEARDRIANVKELLSETREFDIHDEEKTLDSFLGNIALYSETDELNDDNRVTLITLHMAKGLEYKIVFIAGMEEGIFPHFRSLGSTVEMEEERRLCYVGITRGREKVYLTRAYLRNQYGITRGNEMSRFINEIPSSLKDFPHKEQAAAKKTYERDTFMSRSTSSFGENSNAVGEEPQLTGFRLGDKVFHSKFGEGVIVQLEGEGKDLLLSIAFPNSGIKKLLAMYAPIKKLSR